MTSPGPITPGRGGEDTVRGAADGHVLITGGAGFIGSNLAHRLLSDGRRVVVLDDLSRPGVERNLAWLQSRHGEALRIDIADVRDRAAVRRAVRGATHVHHLAAQVAVTTSLEDPASDFEVNAGGTLNVLEAIRAQSDPPSLLFTSTNKVYGSLGDVPITRCGTRHLPDDPGLRAAGISERRSLDLHSPYGCSKGAADQYVIDYARSFGLRTVVFRMSCIYGPQQYGTADQGWVAHFLIRALRGEGITVFGDGRQVRDLLFVDDLVEAMLVAERQVERLSGGAFNIGGGPDNALSVNEVLSLAESLTGHPLMIGHEPWRVGDQRYYVSDTGSFTMATGWTPRVAPRDGIALLYAWLREWTAPSDGIAGRERQRARSAAETMAVAAMDAPG